MTTPVTVIKVKDHSSGSDYPCVLEVQEPIPPDGTYVVYGLKDPRSEQIYYIGQTCKFLVRMRAHCKVYPPEWRERFRPDVLNNRKWAIGMESLSTEVVIFATAPTPSEADELEAHFIQQHLPARTLLNVKTSRWEHREILPSPNLDQSVKG